MWVFFDGTGSLRIGGVLLRPGATEVTDPDVIRRIEEKDKPYITLSETRDGPMLEPEPDPTPEPPSEAPEELYERFQGRDGEWYYLKPGGAGQPTIQSQGYPTELAAEEAIEADQIEAGKVAKAEDVDTSVESGPLLPSELTDKTFDCRAEGCGKTFPSTGARRNHERIFHRDLTKASVAE